MDLNEELTMIAVQDWLDPLLTPGTKGMESIGFLPFLALMGLSALSAFFISILYRVFYRARGTGSEVHRAFPLIGISITAIFISIQFSLPLSLGLLGALSIVRFRTPIKEPEEIGFLMLVVASSLCCATFNLLFLGVVLVVAVATLLAVHVRRGLFGPRRSEGLVVLTLPTADYRGKGGELLSMLGEQFPTGQLDSLNEGPEEVVLSYNFPALEPRRLPGMQERWRAFSETLRADVYLTRDAGG